jgi:hypothetical protein
MDATLMAPAQYSVFLLGLSYNHIDDALSNLAGTSSRATNGGQNAGNILL